MKVEFIVNADINDGRQIFIQESEFRKAKNNEEEYNSFAFATNCLFAFYGYPDDFINPDEYEKILSCLGKGGAVIITIVEERYPRTDGLYEIYADKDYRTIEVLAIYQ